jgi:hypothetical protein
MGWVFRAQRLRERKHKVLEIVIWTFRRAICELGLIHYMLTDSCGREAVKMTSSRGWFGIRNYWSP